MIPRCTDRDTQKLLKQAAKAGWTFSGGGKRHIKCYPPPGTTDLGCVIVAGSPGKRNRAYMNVRAEFRRRGLDV